MEENKKASPTDWKEVHRVSNPKNQAVSIQCLELPNGRKKYSLRLGFQRESGEMSSFVEFRTSKTDNGSVKEDTIDGLVSLLNAAGIWLLERVQQDSAEWEATRTKRDQRRRDFKDNAQAQQKGAHPDTKRTGKTQRDRDRKAGRRVD